MYHQNTLPNSSKQYSTYVIDVVHKIIGQRIDFLEDFITKSFLSKFCPKG